MPRLPDIESLGPRPTPQGGRQIASFDGTAVGRAMQGVSAEIGEVVKKMELEDDNTAVSAARRALNDWEREAVYNPETGAASKSGRDAFGVGKELTKSFDEFAAEVAKGLKGDRQRQAFTDIANSRRQQVLEWADRHVLREREVYQAGEFEASQKSYRERAALKAATATTPQQMGEVAAEIGLMRSQLIDFYRSKGKGDEARDAALFAATSDAHAGVLRTLITSGRTKEADEYFKANQKSIDERDRAVLAGDIRKRADAIEANTAVNDVWSTLGPKKLTEPVVLRTMIETIRAKYAAEPEKANTAVALLRERASAHNEEQREVVASMVNSVMGALEQKKPLSVITQMPEWKEMPATEQRRIREHVEAQQERAIARADAQEARAERALLRKERERERETLSAYFIYSQPENLMRMSPNQIKALAPAIGVERAARLLDKRMDYDKAGGMAAANVDEDAFKTAAQQAGLKVYDSNPSEEQKAAIGHVKNVIETRIHTYQKSAGKPMDREQKAKVMQEVLDDFVIRERPYWFGSDKVLAPLAKPEDKDRTHVVINGTKVMLNSIDPNFIAKRAADRKEEGLPPLTTNQLAAEWLEFKGKK